MSLIRGRLPIAYRVKQGCLNANNRPEKHDYLTVYRNNRNSKGYEVATDVMEKLAELYPAFNNPSESLIIPIRLLYDNPDLNIKTHYACYDGSKTKTPFSKCKGNGCKANRIMKNGTVQEISCPGPDKCEGMTYSTSSGSIVKLCKLQGVFDFELNGIDEFIGGVARYRTAGFNSAANILGQLYHYRKIMGLLRGLPFHIELSKTSSQATTGTLFTFQSLVLSVKGPDALMTLGEAKLAELAMREKYGIDLAKLEEYYMEGSTEDIAFEEGDEDTAAYETEEVPEAEIKNQLDESSKTNKAIAIEAKQQSEEQWKDSVRKSIATGETTVTEAKPKVQRSKVLKPTEFPPDLGGIFPNLNNK